LPLVISFAVLTNFHHFQRRCVYMNKFANAKLLVEGSIVELSYPLTQDWMIHALTKSDTAHPSSSVSQWHT